MNKKIFNEQGFLTLEGKSFVNEVFTKEVRKIIATAHDCSDVLTISCILKAIISEAATSQCHALKNPNSPPPEPNGSKKLKTNLRLIKSEPDSNVIPFPDTSGNLDLAAALAGQISELPSLIGED